MIETSVDLLPFILGSTIVLVLIMIIQYFLKNPQNGLNKAFPFLIGIPATRLLQGILFGMVFDLGISADKTSGKGSIVRPYYWCWGFCC